MLQTQQVYLINILVNVLTYVCDRSKLNYIYSNFFLVHNSYDFNYFNLTQQLLLIIKITVLLDYSSNTRNSLNFVPFMFQQQCIQIHGKYGVFRNDSIYMCIHYTHRTTPIYRAIIQRELYKSYTSLFKLITICCYWMKKKKKKLEHKKKCNFEKLIEIV